MHVLSVASQAQSIATSNLADPSFKPFSLPSTPSNPPIQDNWQERATVKAAQCAVHTEFRQQTEFTRQHRSSQLLIEAALEAT